MNIKWVLCMYRVYRALVHHSPCMSGILLTCTFMRRVQCTILNMFKIVRGARRTKRMVTNQKRWCSALNKWVTNDDEQWHTNHFQCAPRVFFMRSPGVTGHLEKGRSPKGGNLSSNIKGINLSPKLRGTCAQRWRDIKPDFNSRFGGIEATVELWKYLLTVKCAMNKLTQLQHNSVTLQWNQVTACIQYSCNVLYYNTTMQYMRHINIYLFNLFETWKQSTMPRPWALIGITVHTNQAYDSTKGKA